MGKIDSSNKNFQKYGGKASKASAGSNSQAQRRALLEGRISKLVARMALPSIIMQVVSIVYNTVDTFYISQIDKSAAAAVGTVFSIQAVIQAVGFGFGMGVSSVCSRKLGEAADDKANMYASSGIMGAILAALVIECGGLAFLHPLLRAIGCSETMLPYAASYARIVLIFAPIACTTFVINNVLKAEGHLKFSMYGNVTGTLVNVILDPILIFHFGMGAAGAALATGISQVISFCVLYSQFFRKKTVMCLRLSYVSRNIRDYAQIITTGLPTVFRQGLASLAMALLCTRATVYGDAAVAAVTIANKCYMLIRNIVLGLGQGAQPVAGYNYGAGLYRRAKASFDFSIKTGTIFCLAASAALYIFAGNLMWWFCKDDEVLEIGRTALHFYAMVVPLMSLSTIVNQEYQCLGFKVQATFLASCRQGICFVPVILLLPHFIGLWGVCAAQPVSDFLTFVISVPFYIAMSKKLNR